MKRPFISASDPPRKFSEVRAERIASDPRQRVKRMIAETEADARAVDDPSESARLQCEAEEMRSLLDHDFLVSEESA
jgi:hypothetical protein